MAVALAAGGLPGGRSIAWLLIGLAWLAPWLVTGAARREAEAGRLLVQTALAALLAGLAPLPLGPIFLAWLALVPGRAWRDACRGQGGPAEFLAAIALGGLLGVMAGASGPVALPPLALLLAGLVCRAVPEAWRPRRTTGTAVQVVTGPAGRAPTPAGAPAPSASPPGLDLACLGHELRTPLNAIIGFAGLIGQGLAPAEPARLAEYGRIIRSSGEHMLDVLDGLTRTPGGSQSAAGEAVDLAECLSVCLAIMAPAAEQRAVTITVGAVPEVRLQPGEARVLRQALINLLSNAVKYGPPTGTVHLAAALDSGGLLVEVTDSGPGIAGADLARLGSPFVRAGAGRAEVAEGHGLGLAIVRGLLAGAGGELAISSNIGIGTTASLRLPLGAAAAPDREPAPEALPRPDRGLGFTVR